MSEAHNKPKNQQARRPSWTAEDLNAQLRRFDRSPFLELLAYWLELSPDPEAIEIFARKKPDLWVKAIVDLAKISGFSEKQETIHTIRVDRLSDSQLEDRAIELAKRLGLPIPNQKQLELEAEHSSEPRAPENVPNWDKN